ncbi:MAG: hypothetical protein U1D30_12875 [Planctomycetota bacterium]
MPRDTIEKTLIDCEQWLDLVIALGWCSLSRTDLERGNTIQSELEGTGLPELRDALGKVIENFHVDPIQVQVMNDPTDSLGRLLLLLETTREAWQLERLTSPRNRAD